MKQNALDLNDTSPENYFAIIDLKVGRMHKIIKRLDSYMNNYDATFIHKLVESKELTDDNIDYILTKSEKRAFFKRIKAIFIISEIQSDVEQFIEKNKQNMDIYIEYQYKNLYKKRH